MSLCKQCMHKIFWTVIRLYVLNSTHHVLNYVIRKSRNCSSTLLFKFDFFRLRSMCEKFRSIFVASTEKDILHHVMSQSIQIDNCLCYPEDTRHGYTTYMLYSPVYSKANGSASAKVFFFQKTKIDHHGVGLSVFFSHSVTGNYNYFRMYLHFLED